MDIYVINLDRSQERLASFSTINDHLNEVTRFPAIDGRSLDRQDLARRGIVSPTLKSYTDGALGAALSHAALWDYSISSGKVITVCEDDAIFNMQFTSQASGIVKELSTDFDFILWGWNFDLFLAFEMLPGVSLCLAQFEQDRLRVSTDVFQKQAILAHAFKLLWAFGITCYTITPKGARTLKANCLPLETKYIHCPDGLRAAPNLPYFITLGIDNAMNEFYRGMNAFVCFPPLVVTKNDPGTSTTVVLKAPKQ